MTTARAQPRSDAALLPEGRTGHLACIVTATGGVEGRRCYLPTSTAIVISSILGAFPDDFAARMGGECSLRHDLVLPKITDYREGEGFTYDLNYVHKQPDLDVRGGLSETCLSLRRDRFSTER
jgi:hypothetical protein